MQASRVRASMLTAQLDPARARKKVRLEASLPKGRSRASLGHVPNQLFDDVSSTSCMHVEGRHESHSWGNSRFPQLERGFDSSEIPMIFQRRISSTGH